MRHTAAIPILALLALSACAGPDGPADTQVSYHSDASVLLGRYCTACHQAGGIAPFSLTDYQSAKSYAALIRGAVSSGVMPPWMPSDRGVPLRYTRTMRPQDRDLLLSWIDAGAPEGDPAAAPRTDIPAADTVAAPRPDMVLDPGGTYQPDQKLTDDYHCFILDPKLQADTFVSAGSIVPGNASIVHHVIVYEVPVRDAAKLRALETAPGQGYTCFGGPGNGGSAQTVLVWAPGSVPTRAPEGLAIKLSKGSLLVMQVHYNLVNYRSGQVAGDRTTAQLEVSPRRPDRIAVLLGIVDPANLHIKAGDANARQVITVPMKGVLQLFGLPSMQVYANVPHMHMLGKRIESRLTDGRVLVEVPRWDFHWQQLYQFQSPLTLTAADTLEVECDYDNSAGNQPLVNGQRLDPHDVTWGEKTTDEMCLSYMQVALDPATAL